MLTLEQTLKLLHSCEATLGRDLHQVLARLESGDHHISAVWELLVLDAALQIGKANHKPGKNQPDVEISFSNQRKVWIEAAYLFPKHWNEERQTQDVISWIHEEARKRGIQSSWLYTRFDGDQKNEKGPVRTLPQQHEKKVFLGKNEVRNFLKEIEVSPEVPQKCDVVGYSVVIEYHPGESGQYRYSGGLQQEAPKIVEKHAVYVELRTKAKQLKVQEPLIICIGSDQSPALSPVHGPQTPTVGQAVSRAFAEYSRLSAAIIVSIRNEPEFLGGFKRKAQAQIFLNPNTTKPLFEIEIQALKKLDFNRWKYIRPLEKWKNPTATDRRKVGGSLVWRPGAMSTKIEIPINILVDSLAGKTNLLEAFKLKENDIAARPFTEGWTIVASKIVEGNIQAGESPKLELELVQPALAKFWPQK